MKNILKKWWFWLTVTLIIIVLVLTYLLLQKNNTGVGTAGISKEEFENVEIGMSQFEVNEIIDEFDEWYDDEVYEKSCEEISNSQKDHVYTYEYKYYGENNGYAIITFEVNYSDGDYFKMPEVVKKEKFNLK